MRWMVLRDTLWSNMSFQDWLIESKFSKCKAQGTVTWAAYHPNLPRRQLCGFGCAYSSSRVSP